ncbi:MAG: methyltransferase [Rhodobacterales bacterium]|nr:methyltransferase [Rhodobacterales bacterium]
MSDAFSDAELSCNAFLGGRLQILQPLNGYRAGVDPVLLAASIVATPGQSVLELGCGAGVATLCLGARISGLELNGLEIQSNYADLARRNSERNKIEMNVVEGDLSKIPDIFRLRQFDHVIANPPYFLRSKSVSARDTGRETALGEATPLSEWIKIAAKRCAPKGQVSMIHRVERLPEILAGYSAHLGSVQVQPLIARRGRSAQLVIVRGVKNGRADFRLMDGIKMHRGKAHEEDSESYTKTIRSVLRDGADLAF